MEMRSCKNEGHLNRKFDSLSPLMAFTFLARSCAVGVCFGDVFNYISTSEQRADVIEVCDGGARENDGSFGI